jgi:hypothetical protein
MTTTLTKEVLEKYPNDIFVETGTLYGDAVKLAVLCGFKKIYSIEINPDLVRSNRLQFANLIEQGLVEIIEGDTSIIFPELVSRLDGRTTFWLDAHWDGGPMGTVKCPLPMELEAIQSHSIKNHTIMIDDRRCFGIGNWGAGIVESEIIAKVKDINSLYEIAYENGCIPDDIITAVIR